MGCASSKASPVIAQLPSKEQENNKQGSTPVHSTETTKAATKLEGKGDFLGKPSPLAPIGGAPVAPTASHKKAEAFEVSLGNPSSSSGALAPLRIPKGLEEREKTKILTAEELDARQKAAEERRLNSQKEQLSKIKEHTDKVEGTRIQAQKKEKRKQPASNGEELAQAENRREELQKKKQEKLKAREEHAEKVRARSRHLAAIADAAAMDVGGDHVEVGGEQEEDIEDSGSEAAEEPAPSWDQEDDAKSAGYDMEDDDERHF